MRTTLQTKARSKMSGSELKQLIKDGFIPASVSTRGEDTLHCSVSQQKLMDVLAKYGASALIELQGDGDAKGRLVIARDIQRNGVSRRITHVGFQGLSSTATITADVRLTLVGEPNDVKIGMASLEQLIFTVQVRAVPDKLPAHIEIDSSEMHIGSVLHLSDFPAHEGYEIAMPPETVVAVLHTVRGEALPEPPGATTQTAAEEPAAK
jgi:large subunit ribosomal protein L25